MYDYFFISENKLCNNYFVVIIVYYIEGVCLFD